MYSGERLCRLSVRKNLYAENDSSASTKVWGQYLNAFTKLLGISSEDLRLHHSNIYA